MDYAPKDEKIEQYFKPWTTHVFEGEFECGRVKVPFEVVQSTKQMIHMNLGNEFANAYFAVITVCVSSLGDVAVYVDGGDDKIDMQIPLGKIF